MNAQNHSCVVSYTPGYLLLYQERKAIYTEWEQMNRNDSQQARKFVNSWSRTAPMLTDCGTNSQR